MTINDLIASAEEQATEEELKAFEKRTAEREREFNEESRGQAADHEFMARSYNL